MMLDDRNGIGLVEVTTVPLPEGTTQAFPHYTQSGRVLVSYKTARDPSADDYWNFGVMDDDGSGFQRIFSGLVPRKKKANGIRIMPFRDNKRVLLGDYVLECEPDIDACEKSLLLPVSYPWFLKADPRATHHWSEIVIAPDNLHMAWTMLRSDIGAANLMGKLVRRGHRYTIRNPQIISSGFSLKPDPDRPGYVLAPPIRGGEIKQFVHGGTALSLVGGKQTGITDSVIQDLESEEIVQITRTPGYDETTILSPDERLGIVMSTRASKNTNPAIFGLVPRPYATLTSSGITMYLYMYAVAGARFFRKSNIGPILVEITRSMKENDYEGVALNDPEELWVYNSPMSWHPSGTRAIWPEAIRRSEKSSDIGSMRVRKVTLKDYEPAAPIPIQATPDRIPYGNRNPLHLWLCRGMASQVKIAGKHSGYLEVRRGGDKASRAFSGRAESRYVNLSDDGKTYYDGTVVVEYSPGGGGRFEADLNVAGENNGAMKFRAGFSPIAGPEPARLLFGLAADGRPESFGYAEYNGTRLEMSDLLP